MPGDHTDAAGGHRGGRGGPGPGPGPARQGKPEIFNTNQGSQFTSGEFVGLLLANRIEISMDGKGSWRDNVFVERLWRSAKYEEVYLKAYDTVTEARASLGRYFEFYNGRRPHSSHGGLQFDGTTLTRCPPNRQQVN